MYNTDFSRQLDRFKEHLLGAGAVDVQEAALQASRRGYSLPFEGEIVSCELDSVTGEYIPVSRSTRLDESL